MPTSMPSRDSSSGSFRQRIQPVETIDPRVTNPKVGVQVEVRSSLRELLDGEARFPQASAWTVSRRIVSSARPFGALRCGDLLRQFRLTNQHCQSILTGVDIETFSADLSSDDPAIGLRASLALHRLAERVEANHVAAAREKGWSWQQIGDALGVTRQSVHTKYNKESS